MGKGYKFNNLKTFLSWQKMGIRLGAICLASLLWIFVISENVYLMVVDMPVEARNLSARHALKEEVPEYAKVRLRGTGRSLFKTILLSRFIHGFKLVLDLERISEEYDFILNDYFERYPQKVSIPSNFDVSHWLGSVNFSIWFNYTCHGVPCIDNNISPSTEFIKVNCIMCS